MNSPIDPSTEDSFSKWFMTSLGLHIAVLALFVLKSFSMPDQAIEIQSAIRVDLVALPDKNPSEPPSPSVKPVEAEKPTPSTPKPETKEVAKPEPVAVPKKNPALNSKKEDPLVAIKRKQEESFRKMKQELAAEKIKREIEQERQNKRSATFAGNSIHQGDSLTGTQKIQHDRYFSEIEKKVKQSWHLPGWLNNADLKAEALVRIDENGFIVFKKIVASSGNETFDEQVLTALTNAGQFEPPPGSIRNHLMHKGVIFKFPR